MPFWKVLLIGVLGCTCLTLGLGTFIVPISLDADQPRWLYGAGLFLCTAVVGTLFTLFLRNEDRKFTVGGPRRRR